MWREVATRQMTTRWHNVSRGGITCGSFNVTMNYATEQKLWTSHALSLAISCRHLIWETAALVCKWTLLWKLLGAGQVNSGCLTEPCLLKSNRGDWRQQHRVQTQFSSKSNLKNPSWSTIFTSQLSPQCLWSFPARSPLTGLNLSSQSFGCWTLMHYLSHDGIWRSHALHSHTGDGLNLLGMKRSEDNLNLGVT